MPGSPRHNRPIPSVADTDPLDLPFEIDAGTLLDALSHCFTEIFDIGRGRRALIDQEVAMQLGNLRAADDQPAAAGLVDELPSLVAGRVLEGRPAGAALDRLRRLARLGDLVHFGSN